MNIFYVYAIKFSTNEETDYIYRMIITGWRRALNNSDLWSLNPGDRSGRVAPKLAKNWQHQLDKTK